MSTNDTDTYVSYKYLYRYNIHAEYVAVRSLRARKSEDAPLKSHDALMRFENTMYYDLLRLQSAMILDA